jgi:hypothetical protein
MTMVPPQTRQPGATRRLRPHRREAQQRSGWDRYLSVLERQRVPEVQRQWNVRRAETFIKAVGSTRVAEVSAKPITAFFHR